MSKKACRKALTETLEKLAAEDKQVVVITSDARGSVKLNDYVSMFPEQFVEVGIAEQNEVGIASGMATFGMVPFVCAPAPFLSSRSLEQIKTDISYSHSNVKLCGVSGGLSYGALGGTHHAIHDLAAIRPLEGMTVLVPADAAQTAWMTREIAGIKGPVYMRMGRNEVQDIYKDEDISSMRIGKAHMIQDGGDLTIIAAGEMVYSAKCAVDRLEERGVHTRLLDMHTIKPLDMEAVIKAANETGAIMTVEEHSVFGGLGSAVAEAVSQYSAVPMKILGIPDEHVIAGEQTKVFCYYSLDETGIADSAEELLARKK